LRQIQRVIQVCCYQGIGTLRVEVSLGHGVHCTFAPTISQTVNTFPIERNIASRDWFNQLSEETFSQFQLEPDK